MSLQAVQFQEDIDHTAHTTRPKAVAVEDAPEVSVKVPHWPGRVQHQLLIQLRRHGGAAQEFQEKLQRKLIEKLMRAK